MRRQQTCERVRKLLSWRKVISTALGASSLKCKPSILTVPKLLQYRHARLFHHRRRPAHQHLPAHRHHSEQHPPTTHTRTSSAGGGKCACTSSALTRPLSPPHVSAALLRMWCTVKRASFAQLWDVSIGSSSSTRNANMAGDALTPPARRGTGCPLPSGCRRSAIPASCRRRAS